tara:strand:- start:32 stop:820 length:789 start_codon:yes stop_codon:yes gene_type:complete
MATRSKPTTQEVVEINRAEQISRKDDKVNDVSIGLMDIDKAIMYYFEKVVNPKVINNGENVKVPVRYAMPERWASIQRDGVYRDIKGNLLLPIIAIKRTSIAKHDGMTVDDLDGNLFYTFESKYTKKNRYDRFSVQQGIKPKQELYNVAVPDYQKLTYSVIVLTDYMEQMNNIIETIVHSEGKYWGEPGKFRFRNKIESIEDNTEITTESDRVVKSTFNMEFDGYLIPKSFDYKPLTQKTITPGRIIIQEGDPIDKSDVFDQ